jgi:hypothetical protein
MIDTITTDQDLLITLHNVYMNQVTASLSSSVIVDKGDSLTGFQLNNIIDAIERNIKTLTEARDRLERDF